MNIFHHVSARVRKTFFPTLLDKEHQRWIADKAELINRYNYDTLNASSNVIDVGGFEGQWTSNIFSKYLCNIFVFEPVPVYAVQIEKRFKYNESIKVFNKALGDTSKVARISFAGSGSSFFKGISNTEVNVEDAANLFDISGIDHCDLIKINIEGSEYEVIPRLIDSGLIHNCDNLQIQFHRLGRDSLTQMESIQTRLSETHELTWQYIWVWENWKRKPISSA